MVIDEMVTIPHSWNRTDAQEGIPYFRGEGTYTKMFIAEESWVGKRIFIHFEGVNIIAKVQLNDREIGTHKGGYAAFSYEITDQLLLGQENELVVTVSNAVNSEVIPLVGDFNNYGGIYRPIQLIIADEICITPLDYASPGIYIRQRNVSKGSAEVNVLTKISNGSDSNHEIGYQTVILNAKGEVVSKQLTKHTVALGTTDLTHDYNIENPRLWNGKKDPYLYKVKVNILKNGVVVDSKTEPLGFRYFSVDANKGFFLNGEPIDLRGVSRHQDRKDKASAISNEDHREDMDLMLEMGINTLRLAHYQHAEIVYDMADEAGLVVWAELPWVGIPSGFLSQSNGFENTKAFKTNAKQQLYELIRQNFNHPSILMWSIFNEIQNPEDARPTDFINELNALVKAEDPDRLSVGASMLSPQENENIHNITDIIAWNKYFGWYYKEPKDMGLFLDQLHNDFPNYKVGISEYGAGGSIYQHADKLERPNPMGSPHPEEWQSFYHEENLKIFDERPYVWGTYIWNMFDFGSHFRKEGDHYGINDKGMVTYDRKTKKDVFFFYKANWSEEPVLHITSSRYIFRKEMNTKVKAYTNLSDISLKVNGKEFEVKNPKKGIVSWEDITLQIGNNEIIVSGSKDGKIYYDSCVWVFEEQYSGMNLFIKIFDFMKVAYKVAFAMLIAAFLLWFLVLRRIIKAKWKRIALWGVVVLLTLLSILVAFSKYYMSNMMGG
ncbi:glycoside hydrolase family 2 protein [Moorena bouillonii]|uniref:glycoside hydrolase family 2 protein n=1 Tax=Moorena bouillonii TaxID=207920 RepID=UPI00130175CF|nr:glycoside hydrolase family 2 TIM barrel-domain containing protein [Moorena bouillonii]